MRRKYLTVLSVIILGFLFVSCNSSKKQQDFSECKKHLDSLARACEIFASHNNGHYPKALEELVEKGHMRKIPACPASGKPYVYFSQENPDFFLIKCPQANVHKDTGMVGEGNYPVYNSKEGMVLKGDYLSSIASSSATPCISQTQLQPSPTEEEATPTPRVIVTKNTQLPSETMQPSDTPVSTHQKEINQKAKDHNSKGLGYMKQDKYDLAMEEFEEAIKIDADYAEAIKNKGNVYYYKGDMTKALECYKLTVAKDPSYWNGYNNIGNVYYDQGDLDNAQKYYTQAVNCCKDDLKPYNNLGGILVEKGKYQEAIDNYNKALGFGLENAELHSQLGYCNWQLAQGYLEKQDKDTAWKYANKALEGFSKACEMDPNDPVPAFRAGIVYFNFGPNYFDKAIKCMDKALELTPDNYKYLYSRGQIYQAKGDPAKARKDYDSALSQAQTAKDSDMEKKIKQALSSLNKDNQ